MGSLKKLIDRYVKKGVVSNPISYQTGRIKRMRNTIPKHRCPALSKRIGCYRTFLITTLPTEIFSKVLFGITRWNRH